MARKRQTTQPFVISLDNFSGGLNTFVSPLLLDKQCPDLNNVVVDEPVGVVKKIKGVSVFNNKNIPGQKVIRGVEYVKSTGDTFLVICVLGNDNKYRVFYSQNGVDDWIQIGEASTSSYNFAVLDDILWVVNSVSTPFIFNGLEIKWLNGQGVDWDNKPLANFTLPLGMTPGKYICVHQNRIVMANTIENGSEIIFSRFVDDDGNIIKATTNDAWINTNQILINPDDGDEITAIYPYLNMLCVFKKNGIYIVSGELTNPSVINIPTDKGCISQDSIQEVRNLLFYLSHDGVYSFNGREAVLVSQDIQSFFKDVEGEEGADINSIRISTTQEFETAQIEKSNFRTVGSAENSLSSPKNFVLDNSDDFFNNKYSDNNILYSDGIQLKMKTPLINYTVQPNGRTTEGDIKNIFDGDYGTFFKVRSFSQWSAKVEMDETASIKINIRLNNVFVKSFTIKYHLVARTTGGNLPFGGAAIWYKTDKMDKYSRLNRIKVNEVIHPITNTININQNINELEIKAESQASTSMFPPIIPVYMDATAEILIYELSIDYETEREGEGDYITQWIDSEQTSGQRFSNFIVETDKPVGTNIRFYYAQSDYLIPLDEATWVEIQHNDIPQITKRYYAYKIVLFTSEVLKTPIVKSLRQNFHPNSLWIGKKELATVPVKWGFFYCSYNKNGGILTFKLSKDNVNYYPVENGDDISQILAGSNKVFVKIEATREGDDKTPQVFALFFTYYTKEPELFEPVSSLQKENRYFLKLPDKTILVFNKTGVWTKLKLVDDVHTFTDFLAEDIVFLTITLGDGTKVLRAYKFLSDVWTSYSDLTTKTVILGTPLEVFLIRKIWIFMDKQVNTDIDFKLEVYDLKKPTPVYEKSLTFYRAKNITLPIELNTGIKCYQFYCKIIQTNKNQDFGFIGLQFLIQPIRILSKEE